MFSKIIFLVLVIFALFGFFLTNLSLGEYNTYIHQFIIKIIYSKTFFWIIAIAIYIFIIAITVIIIVSVIHNHYWNFLYEHFPEQFIY